MQVTAASTGVRDLLHSGAKLDDPVAWRSREGTMDVTPN